MTGSPRQPPMIPNYEAAIIGGGIAGIAAGIKLKQAGIYNFVLLERAEDIGGTWHYHTYPGVACDVPSPTYQFAFERNPNWSRMCAPGPEIKAYLQHCVDKYGVRPHVQLNSEVVKCEFDEASHFWRVELADDRIVTARHLISAPGAFTVPKWPEVPGVKDFQGKHMHSMQWDHSYDMTGKRVAVIGTGSSAVQIIPTLAPDVERMQVFQRTPATPIPSYDVPIPRPFRVFLRAFPGATRAVRWATTASMEVVFVVAIHYHKKLPFVRRLVELAGLGLLWVQVPDPELRKQLTPHYNFGCKRPAINNKYLRAFTRKNVELITDSVERITLTGVRTRDGREFDADVLVYATGYKLWELVEDSPWPVIGRKGLNLWKYWYENRLQSYQGSSVPAFPNLFLVPGWYGAFTGTDYFGGAEAQADHAVKCIVEARRRGATAIEVRKDASDAYFVEQLRRRGGQIFYHNDCSKANTYYYDRHGDVPVFRATTTVEAQWRARHVNFADYEFHNLPTVGTRRRRRNRQSAGVA